MGSTRKGMLNVLIAAVLWGSSGVCAQYIMEQSQMSPPMQIGDLTFRICCKSVHFIEYFSIICHTNIGILFELSIRQVKNSANSAPHNKPRCIDLWVVPPGIESLLQISSCISLPLSLSPIEYLSLSSLSPPLLFS